jgi:hypothetical protein
MIRSLCKCGQVNASEMDVDWIKSGSVPFTCTKCGNVYVVKVTVDSEDITVEEFDECEKDECDKLTHPINSEITIENQGHELHNKCGTIVDKDYVHYRIRFEDGKMIWVPSHWVVLKKTI